MKRTRLADRLTPGYSRGEELANVISHAVGAALGLAALIWCLALANTATETAAAAVYGLSMLLLYAVSSIYHGLKPPTAKKVFQVLDHCAIYVYIAGTYTIVLLCSLRPEYPVVAWTLFGVEWAAAAAAVTLNAVDLKRYEKFSLACYIIMGWSVALAIVPVFRALGPGGSLLLLAGGVSYTAGSVLYVVGKKRKYAHSVFHFFVLLGSLLQLLCVAVYVL